VLTKKLTVQNETTFEQNTNSFFSGKQLKVFNRWMNLAKMAHRTFSILTKVMPPPSPEREKENFMKNAIFNKNRTF
jgi:hypothetical protein